MNDNDKINILMVDDQPAKLLSYETILGGLGENLIKANSAQEALECLLKNEIAVVLMDVSMPDLDGFELAEMIRQHPRYQQTAIIFVSAVHLSEFDQVKGYERGAVDYVSVPVIPQILRAKVGVFVELYRKTKQLERMNQELEQRVAERTKELQLRAEELTRLNTELTRSNQELDAFAYIASHDLKEPLRGIHNYAHFLLEDYLERLDEEGQQKLHVLMRLTQRMELLIDSLLYYSRMGRMELSLREVDMNDALNEALEMLTSRLKQDNIEVRLPRRLPVIWADHARIGEVFSNLISNAIKYNDKAKKWVEIGWEERMGQGDKETGGLGDKETGGLGDKGDVSPTPLLPLSPPAPIFYVQDNGIGIPEKHHENIFRIFRRLHGRDEYGGGTGAGLTIAKKIVERHGGRIWVESQPGKGATFYFTLTNEQNAQPNTTFAAANSAD